MGRIYLLILRSWRGSVSAPRAGVILDVTIKPRVPAFLPIRGIVVVNSGTRVQEAEEDVL